MANLSDSIFNIQTLDEVSDKNTFIHNRHPLVKLIVTLAYIVSVISFDKYEIVMLMPFFLYIILIFSLGEISVGVILKRTFLAMTFVIGIGIFNIFFYNGSFSFEGIYRMKGYIVFLSIAIKSFLTITSSLLLLSTTGMDNIALALRMIKIPKIFVLQILLTYRYISILLNEVLTICRAYSLRNPKKKGIEFKDWGNFAGSLLIRSYDRAENVYAAMVLKGFKGEYNTGAKKELIKMDYIYLMIFIGMFLIFRFIDISKIIGRLFEMGLG